MHRKSDLDMFPQDTELERTLRNLRKVRRIETTTMADERMGQKDKHEITTERTQGQTQWRISRGQ